MTRYHATASIDAAADLAWRLLADIERWPSWLPTVSSVTPLGAPALQVGARFRVTQPRLRPAIWTVSDLRAGRFFAWQARAPGLSMRAEHAIRATGPDRCDVALTFSFSGWLAPLVAWLMGRLTQRYLGQEAVALKALAERSRPPARPSAAGARSPQT